MSIEEHFEMGDKITLVSEECSNERLREQIGKVFTIKEMTKCFPSNNEVCKDRPNCGGYGVRVNEISINDTSWCCYIFKQIKRRGSKHSSSNLALPSSKEWRKIIDK